MALTTYHDNENISQRPNRSLKASTQLVTLALSMGVTARLINESYENHRKYDACGSTFSPQKCVELNGIKFSIAGARLYLSARTRRKPYIAQQQKETT